MLSTILNAARRYFAGMFFYPDTERLATPADLGMKSEEVTFRSGSNDLQGFLMPAKGASRGLILHCHGNAGNVTSHFAQVRFLVEAGFDVFTFDYAGFGRSTGQPSLQGIEDDARFALTYLLGRGDLTHDRIAIFGQSLGGAAAAVASAHPAVRCLILEATFTTYRDIAWSTLIGKALFFLVPFVIPKGGPACHLQAFAPRPILLVHGEADEVVPVRFSRRLHELFPNNTVLHTSPGIQHLSAGIDETPLFNDAILKFLNDHLARS